MAEIPVIADKTNYLNIAQQAALIVNESMAEQFQAAKEGGYEASDLDLDSLIKVAQVNYLAAIAEGLKKLGA